jgi:hypothetical protein
VKTKQVIYIAGAGALAGGLAFVGSRLVLREGVRQKIVASPMYAKARLAADAAALVGFDAGLPTADALASAMVPLFSTASPYEAAQDIQQFGRESRFWPPDYKTSSLPYGLEMALITVAVAVAGRKQGQIEAA